MSRTIKYLFPLVLFGAVFTAQAQTSAQPAAQTPGTLVIVPAFGQVKHANDEARATFMVEEQDKDKAAAASRANQKMKQGMDIVKRADPQALLQTRGYYTYPVYADDQPRAAGKLRQVVGWRVGQYLDMTTTSLDALPATVAAAQKVLALNGLSFGLTDATARKLDEQRIAATYRNLTERIEAIAKAMGRSPADTMLDTIDFEGSGAYVPQQEAYAAKAMRATAMDATQQVAEPSFEPGETTLDMRAVGKVRFR